MRPMTTFEAKLLLADERIGNQGHLARIRSSGKIGVARRASRGPSHWMSPRRENRSTSPCPGIPQVSERRSQALFSPMTPSIEPARATFEVDANKLFLSKEIPVAGALGFEPRITGPKPVALPLGHAPVRTARDPSDAAAQPLYREAGMPATAESLAPR